MTSEHQAAIEQEWRALLPAGAAVVDSHTHLGLDEDGQSLDLATLLARLDDVGADARACAFPLHDPERRPAYRRPNDRVLAWAAESGGRVIPYCRLDPADGPVEEAERCLARGARGIKLHPRAQEFGFEPGPVESIFAVARDAGVPILIHAGRGMPPMDALADVALHHPEVPLVLAHAGIAGQGMFATRLREHPAVLYDTSCFSPFDLVELFARVPAERIVFASDIPYGRPTSGLFLALRVAALAGLDAQDRARLVGGTMDAVLQRAPLAPPTPPRLAGLRLADGRLLRAAGYLMMGFGSMLASGPPRDPRLLLPGLALARCVCRDPDAGEALERIDGLLADVEGLIEADPAAGIAAIGLFHAALVIAGTEPA